MNNMNKYLNYLVACLLSLAALSSCSDDNEPAPVPEPDPTPSGYCLMFYMSGGDPEHDVTLMESARKQQQYRMTTLPLRYCIKTPVKEKAKRTTARTVTPRRMAF